MISGGTTRVPALSTFCFSDGQGVYTLRPAAAEDLPLAKLWNGEDADHAQRVDPLFWVTQSARSDAYLLTEYATGEPLFFLKLCTVTGRRGTVELHIQFDPGVGGAARERRGKALRDGLGWLERTLKVSGATEIIFRSRNSQLILFAVKRLGFVTDPVTENGETILRKQLAARGTGKDPNLNVRSDGCSDATAN